MSEPCIITVAITGAVPRKKDTPAVPVTVAEQVESTHDAYEAGASIAHVHVRDENENPSSDPEKFGAFQEGLRKHCPDMIVQFSTGGRGRGADQRGSMLHLQPDTASRSEERTTELQSLMRHSYAVLCLKQKTLIHHQT